ncbi:MAG TPA: hypothetical protein VEH82_01615, partial [Acidimicrobiales bacterium]|nr:hypothetical protein [Acidimicrobiales bacterium]
MPAADSSAPAHQHPHAHAAPTVRVGLLGCGNVGAALARFLLMDSKRIADRTGVQLELAKVAVRSATKERDVPGVEALLTTD